MKNNLKEIMDKMIEKHGTDITITWEGGNDDGSYNLLVDGVEVSINWGNKESIEYRLIDAIGDIIGYYSFAGDFNCNGEVVYDPKQNAFVGNDYYEETESYEYKIPVPIKIVIPKDLWFDRIDIDISGYEDNPDCQARFLITNGPVAPEHMEIENRITNLVETTLLETLMRDQLDICNVFFDDSLTPDSMPTDKDGNRLIYIDEIGYSKYVGKDTGLFIEIPNQ